MLFQKVMNLSCRILHTNMGQKVVVLNHMDTYKSFVVVKMGLD